MRILPDSIAGRIGWLLATGLVLTTAATWLSSGWDRAGRILERVATLAAVANSASAAARPAVIPALNQAGLTVSWAADAVLPALSQDFASRHLAHDVRASIKDAGLDRVEAGTPSDAPGRPMEVWIRLADGTWLQIRMDRDIAGSFGVGRILTSLGVLTVGIVLLAVWVGGRVTAPLGRFAEAAQRLGSDVNTSPIPETGPVEIRRAAGAFNRMQARVRRLVEDRTLMLAAISHDLRTMIARLRLRAEYIEPKDQRAKALADLDEMLAMLRSALTFARDDASADPATRLDLAVLLQSLCDDLRDAGKPVQYEGPLHFAFSGQPVALRRAFANLIDNAIAYGGEAAVVLAKLDAGVEVTVGDRGPGIPPSIRARVFAPFFRGEPSRSRETGGTGLGLTIARAVVDRHNGSISLEDRPGGGLLVRVFLAPTPVLE